MLVLTPKKNRLIFSWFQFDVGIDIKKNRLIFSWFQFDVGTDIKKNRLIFSWFQFNVGIDTNKNRLIFSWFQFDFFHIWSEYSLYCLHCLTYGHMITRIIIVTHTEFWPFAFLLWLSGSKRSILFLSVCFYFLSFFLSKRGSSSVNRCHMQCNQFWSQFSFCTHKNLVYSWSPEIISPAFFLTGQKYYIHALAHTCNTDDKWNKMAQRRGLAKETVSDLPLQKVSLQTTSKKKKKKIIVRTLLTINCVLAMPHKHFRDRIATRVPLRSVLELVSLPRSFSMKQEREINLKKERESEKLKERSCYWPTSV